MQPTPHPELHDDDRPVGRVLTRREILALLGGGGAAVIAAAYAPGVLAQDATSSPAPTLAASPGASPLPACIVRPELTEGPFFVDEQLDRSDIRPDPTTGEVQPGVPLVLRFLVARLEGSACTTFEGAMVDVWHCNAVGRYSDEEQNGTTGQKWLRGYQLTDPSGLATFTTIYPGAYPGRTVHIHFKIRTDPGATGSLEFTSQLFFEDTLTDQVQALDPYRSTGTRTTRNDADGIFGQSQGLTTLALAAEGEGYGSTFEVGLQVA